MAKAKAPKAAAPVAAAPAAPIAATPARSEVKGSGTAKPAAPREVSPDQIATRAFEIYAGRGYAPGDQNADWLEAERHSAPGFNSRNAFPNFSSLKDPLS